MPHVIIKFFDTTLTDANKVALARSLTQTLTATLGCTAGAVSIALRPVQPADWNEEVFVPDISRRGTELIKMPDYAALAAPAQKEKES